MANEKKKLTRSRDDRWLAGVCGGIAEYFDVDATLIRVLFILFSFAVGGGLIIYIILWIIMPESAGESATVDFADELKSQEQDTAADQSEPTADEEEADLGDDEA